MVSGAATLVAPARLVAKDADPKTVGTIEGPAGARSKGPTWMRFFPPRLLSLFPSWPSRLSGFDVSWVRVGMSCIGASPPRPISQPYGPSCPSITPASQKRLACVSFWVAPDLATFVFHKRRRALRTIHKSEAGSSSHRCTVAIALACVQQNVAARLFRLWEERAREGESQKARMIVLSRTVTCGLADQLRPSTRTKGSGGRRPQRRALAPYARRPRRVTVEASRSQAKVRRALRLV